MGPALDAAEVGAADAVLISHDDHPDNLDTSGRQYALAAGRVVTGIGSARRLGDAAVGLAPWGSVKLTRPGAKPLTVTAVPAVHGPEDGERNEAGFVNCEVVGFVLEGTGLPTVYVSGDNASVRVVATVAARFPRIDWAVLNVGAARVSAKFGGRALSMTSQRAAAAAQVLAPARIVPAHYSGWAHFSEGVDQIHEAFDDAGVGGLLRMVDHGVPVPID